VLLTEVRESQGLTEKIDVVPQPAEALLGDGDRLRCQNGSCVVDGNLIFYGHRPAWIIVGAAQIVAVKAFRHRGSVDAGIGEKCWLSKQFYVFIFLR